MYCCHNVGEQSKGTRCLTSIFNHTSMICYKILFCVCVKSVPRIRTYMESDHFIQWPCMLTSAFWSNRWWSYSHSLQCSYVSILMALTKFNYCLPAFSKEIMFSFVFFPCFDFMSSHLLFGYFKNQFSIYLLFYSNLWVLCPSERIITFDWTQHVYIT